MDIAIFGMTGKMGKSVLQAATSDSEIALIFGTVRPGSPLIDLSSPKTRMCPDPEHALAHCDVAIDFSTREAAIHHVQAAARAKKALVLGTTNLCADTQQAIELASQEIPIIVSANFSLGIALCLDVARFLSGTLGDRSAISIFETHHIHKKDRPSGTALTFAHTMKNASRNDKIPIHSHREAEAIGEHTVVFECGHERIELKHIAHSREAFAFGALLAAKRLFGKPAGLYSLQELVNGHRAE